MTGFYIVAKTSMCLKICLFYINCNILVVSPFFNLTIQRIRRDIALAWHLLQLKIQLLAYDDKAMLWDKGHNSRISINRIISLKSFDKIS